MNITWSSFYVLNNDNIREYVPTSAGVYLFWVKLKNDKWHCFYVGQTNDLETRFIQHLSSSEQNECLKTNISKYICGFEYAKVSKQDDRNGIEKFLYDHYSPECNESDPGGIPIEVNIP